MKKHFRVIIMVATVAIHRIIAALDFPHKVNDFINYAKAIRESMAASAYFTALATDITALQAAIVTLDNKESGLKAKPATSTGPERDGAWTIVQNLLRGLRGGVQTLADADVPNAETIITAAGMHVKRIGTRGKGAFKVEFGGISGSVKLTAAGIPGNHGSHEWQYSSDGTNWISVTSTVDATTIIPNLIPGSILDFRHHTITRDGESEWENVDDYVVQ